MCTTDVGFKIKIFKFKITVTKSSNSRSKFFNSFLNSEKILVKYPEKWPVIKTFSTNQSHGLSQNVQAVEVEPLQNKNSYQEKESWKQNNKEIESRIKFRCYETSNSQPLT